MDAHPRFFSSEMPQFSWLGSIINMPSDGEVANCILRRLNAKDKYIPLMPEYQHVLRSHVVLIEVIRDLEDGEEFLIKYGWDEEIRAKLFQRVKSCLINVDNEIPYNEINALIDAAEGLNDEIYVEEEVINSDEVDIDRDVGSIFMTNAKMIIVCTQNAINTNEKIKAKKTAIRDHFKMHRYKR